jgi:metallo-beta-lactamase family protein
MQITFHGAAKTTTGSMHLLDVNGRRILLDCGLYQGRRKHAFEKNRNLGFDASTIDTVVLSHAHIDHSGNLPSLVKNGFSGTIWATPATRDLCGIMLLDSAYLQARDVRHVNKRRVREGKVPFESLYDDADVHETFMRFRGLGYGKTMKIAPGVEITFHDAGHILGSALTTIDVTENGRTRRVLFTGDVGREAMPILEDPQVVTDVDILITESTYGNRLHPAEEDVKHSLEELGRRIIDRSSRLIIPAFSVGRTQQVLYFLRELYSEGRLPEIPIYVDSPLAIRATRVYDDHDECYDREMLDMIRTEGGPFSMRALTYTEDVADSKKLNDVAGPVIIISASGMCEGGRILHHLKRSIGDPDNVILIVGYQAQHTLGRRIVQRKQPIRIFGDEFELNAEVRSIQALSAHADYEELLAYFRKMGPEVDRAFVVHGEEDQAEAFGERLRRLGAKKVTVPDEGQTLEV